MVGQDVDVPVVQLGLGLLPYAAPAGAVPTGVVWGVGGAEGQV